MTYRRDAQRDDTTVPLPIETVYNSDMDSLREPPIPNYYRKEEELKVKRTVAHVKHNGRSNRIYFNYPPEWKTSNVGEKIIGVRNMMIRRRDGDLRFNLFIRKYSRRTKYDIFAGLKGDIDSKLQQLIEYRHEMMTSMGENPNEHINVYRIPIDIRITTNDTWDDIRERIMNVIRQHDLYHYLYRRLNELYTLPDTLTPKLQKLDQIQDNYQAMLNESFDLIGERITYWLEPDKDVNIIRSIEDGHECLKFVSPSNYNVTNYMADFLIMRSYPEDSVDMFYKCLYQLDDNGRFTGLSANRDLNEGDLDGFRFEPYTELFFNIMYPDYTDGDNPIDYLLKYHGELTFKNVMLGDCQVAASFASQSNHNLIGRTNETFTPIKYYKINDEDDHFWVEFYDRDRVDTPLTFNDFYIFTMDVVFLQNRKLLYT